MISLDKLKQLIEHYKQMPDELGFAPSALNVQLLKSVFKVACGEIPSNSQIAQLVRCNLVYFDEARMPLLTARGKNILEMFFNPF